MSKSGKKIEPWRVIVFIIAAGFIVYMWIKKGVADIYATMPADEALPLIVTTVAVSLLKVAAIACGILLIKWVIGRVKKK